MPSIPAPAPGVAASQPAPRPASRPATPPKPRLTLADAQQKARTLYREAFDADVEGDLDKAARLYKQIMDDLPEKIDGQEVWPTDVKLRYEQVVAARGGK